VCELFAMSSRFPATVQLSLEELARHGGETGVHRDGWGVAFYEDADVRLLKEAAPAAGSPLVRFVQDHPPESRLVIGHVRKATQGDHRFANCQPFARELGGRMHVFGHNGDLDRDELAAVARPARFRPIGTTDSERAFCALLDRLAPLWADGPAPPPLDARLAIVAGFAAALRPLGPANFLYADGDAIFVHGHRRTQTDGGIRAPGVHVLCRTCAAEGGHEAFRAVGVEIAAGGGAGDRQEVVLAASVPLTREAAWSALEEGEVIAARDGRIVARLRAGEAVLVPA
jgi:predicted glutamine amidotransferase